MSTRKPARSLIFRWTTFKGFAAILLFLLLTVLVEYGVVLYSMELGVKDERLLEWSLQLPSTDWNVTVAASSLFHLVPISVIISLVSSWMYLMRHVGMKPSERGKGKPRSVYRHGKKRRFRHVQKLASDIVDFFGRVKSRLLKIRSIAYIWGKIDSAKVTIKSALIVLLVFGSLIVLISLFTYPQLIHQTVLGAYQNNHQLLGFVKSIGSLSESLTETLAPILVSSAPGLRDLVSRIGVLTRPLVELDNVGKYLVFQNAAASVSALIVLFHGTFRREGYRKRGRKV